MDPHGDITVVIIIVVIVKRALTFGYDYSSWAKRLPKRLSEVQVIFRIVIAIFILLNADIIWRNGGEGQSDISSSMDATGTDISNSIAKIVAALN